MGRRGCRGLALPVGLGQGRRLWDSWEDVPLRSLMKRQTYICSPGLRSPRRGPGGCPGCPHANLHCRKLGGGSSCSWNIGPHSQNCLCLWWGGSLREDGAGRGAARGGRGGGGGDTGRGHGRGRWVWTRGWPPGVDGSTRCSCPTRRRAQLLRGPGLRCGRCWGWRFPALLLGMPSAGSELPVTGGV